MTYITRTPKDKDHPFVRVDIKIITNSNGKKHNIGDGAFRLLCFMLSKPDNWKFNLERLSIEMNKKISTIRKHARELESAGYLIKYPIKKKDGTFSGWEISILEKPYILSP